MGLEMTELMRRFNGAFQQHDPKALEPLVAEECFIENTTPAPNGSPHEGRQACLELWQGIASNRDVRFELEDTEVFGDFAVIRWRFCWGQSEADSVRGVNLMRAKHGLIVEARGYVKGS
jgi:ketosteroid isomerase-like protein